MRVSIFLVLLLTIWFGGCQSSSEELEIIVIEDNNAPPDLNIPTVIKQNYINKLYISMLGRKPDEAENNVALGMLDQDNASQTQRQALIAMVQDNPVYFERQYEVARVNLLNNIDTSEISDQIRIYEVIKNDPRYTDFIELIEYEQDRLIRLRQVPFLLPNKGINRVEMHRRCVDNSFYDDINMGTQNFVLSLFESFLNRYPTHAEELAASQMVDGVNVVLFGAEGDSKTEMIDIFFSSDNYYEGVVLAVYQDFLFRLPNSVEMSEGTKLYRQSANYEELLQEILSTDEYMGLD